MTRKLSISVPDDIAEILDEQPNVSAYITSLIVRRTERQQHDEIMRAVGLDPATLGSPAAKARVRAALYVSPEQAERGRELARKLAAGEDVDL